MCRFGLSPAALLNLIVPVHSYESGATPVEKPVPPRTLLRASIKVILSAKVGAWDSKNVGVLQTFEILKYGVHDLRRFWIISTLILLCFPVSTRISHFCT